jgi:glycosyltransferase involved in cell wall biosynthesis
MSAGAPPRIVIDARELRTTTGRYVERLLHYLQQRDGEERFIVLLKPNDFDRWQPTNPRFSKQVGRFKEFSFGEQLGFWRQLHALRADLVHFPMAQQPVLYGGAVVTSIMDLTTARFNNPAKQPLVFWFKQQLYKAVVRRVARRSRRLITISNFVRDDLAQFASIDPGKITTTYLAADRIDAAAEPLPALAGQRFILAVGRSLPHKNLARLLDAFALVHQQDPALRLVFAGPRDALSQQLEHKAQALGLRGAVDFAGFVSEGQLRWLYEHTCAYVLPSLSEGFGLPALEAMVHGAPVVASNATCLPEVCGDGAHYFDPVHPSAMAQAILEVVNDPALATRLAQAGARVAARYSWERCADQTLAVYRQALA